MSSTGSSATEKHTPDFDFTHYVLDPALTEKQLIDLRKQIDEHMRPGSDDELLKSLIRVKILTAAPGTSESEYELLMRTYLAELKKYPRDAVLDALEHIADRHTFFPAWKEMRSDIVYRCRRREALAAAIDLALERHRKAQIRRAVG